MLLLYQPLLTTELVVLKFTFHYSKEDNRKKKIYRKKVQGHLFPLLFRLGRNFEANIYCSFKVPIWTWPSLYWEKQRSRIVDVHSINNSILKHMQKESTAQAIINLTWPNFRAIDLTTQIMFLCAQFLYAISRFTVSKKECVNNFSWA